MRRHKSRDLPPCTSAHCRRTKNPCMNIPYPKYPCKGRNSFRGTTLLPAETGRLSIGVTCLFPFFTTHDLSSFSRKPLRCELKASSEPEKAFSRWPFLSAGNNWLFCTVTAFKLFYILVTFPQAVKYFIIVSIIISCFIFPFSYTDAFQSFPQVLFHRFQSLHHTNKNKFSDLIPHEAVLNEGNTPHLSSLLPTFLPSVHCM